jgi:hypothetical protein
VPRRTTAPDLEAFRRFALDLGEMGLDHLGAELARF